MTVEAAPLSTKCTICGEPGSGNFCSSCGHEFARPKMSWLEKVPFLGERLNFVSTLGRILRHPVIEPVRLATTVGYRGHFGLLLAALAVWGAFNFVQMSAAGGPQNAGGVASPTNLLFFVDISVACLIAWALLRMLAPEPAGFDQHVKLWMILAAFYLVAYLLVLFVVSLVLVAIDEFFPEVFASFALSVPVIGYWLIQTIKAATVALYAAGLARLWKMPFWQSILLLVLAIGLAIYPSYWIQYGLGFIYGAFLSGWGPEPTSAGTTLTQVLPFA